jgi:hypothetical protein
MARRYSKKAHFHVKAFALGLSGIGMLAHGGQVHALKRGDTVTAAWNNVGKALNRAATRSETDRRKEARAS